MPGRHVAHTAGSARVQTLRRIGFGAVVILALAGVGLGARALFTGNDSCTESVTVTVAADPTIAPAVSELAASYSRPVPRVNDACVSVQVQAVGSADVARALDQTTADLWIPTSSRWTLGLPDPAAVASEGSVALSPLVVVAPRAAATQLGWPDAAFSWTAALDTGTAMIPDPLTTGEGLATLLAVRAALGPDVEETTLVQIMTEVSESTVPSVEEAYAALESAGDQAALFTATEQSVIAHNLRSGTTPVVALYPVEGTMAFDYPALTVDRSGAPVGAAAAVAAFVDYLKTSKAQDTIRAAGFRGADGVAARSAGADAGVQAAMPTILPDPEPAVVSALVRQWAALTLDMRMLAVIDVSGSMNEVVEGGATRIEITRDAAKAALALLPTSSSVGLWAFSILQDPPRDYIELVDVGPLEQPVGDGTRLEALVAAADTLPSRANGGTGLYDTALAAFQHMRSTYEPGKVNSVVLLTDGRNEDDPGGIDLESLLATLRAQFDPVQPVPIITIGTGPDADMEALQQISEATGTTAYRAEDPRDIQQVFLQAMIERQCRPNC